jgi:hypothetical protein
MMIIGCDFHTRYQQIAMGRVARTLFRLFFFMWTEMSAANIPCL